MVATALQTAAKVVPVLSKPLNAAAKVAYTVAKNYEKVVKAVAAAKQAKATKPVQTPTPTRDRPKKPKPIPTPKEEPLPEPAPTPLPPGVEPIPYYETMDDAAYAFLMEYQKISQDKNKEYGAVIYKGHYGYYLGNTQIGNSGSVAGIWFESTFKFGVGTVHTHPDAYKTAEPQNYACGFSYGVLFNSKGQWFGDNWLPVVRYLGAPNGCMYKSVDGGPNTIVATDLPVHQSAIDLNVPQEVFPNHY